ncbi:MAG TPA: hypothetical protein VGE55_03275 [Limnobacter sp.]|uniref:hypothetical protein n=1 Tax=Limnobacter sp. TaxID=2003368 RepID=UPI002ED8AF6E
MFEKDTMLNQAGRSCPIRYRYGAHAVGQSPVTVCNTLYVIGGLYGNPFALQEVLRMASAEPGPVRLCFNGDFNWFNTTDEAFVGINAQVLQHDCVLGNVEAELGEPLDAPDCGCAYPDHVDQGVVDRSNLIHTALKRVAQRNPDWIAQLNAQPFYRRYQVGKLRVGVVHGDSESLAGWRFDPSHFDDPREALWRAAQFMTAGVQVFASSHTCTAGFLNEPAGLISNNGAAGMPSVAGNTAGMITRIGLQPWTEGAAVARVRRDGVWCEQLPVAYDQAQWLSLFEQWWPAGSAAHLSYFRRIAEGV